MTPDQIRQARQAAKLSQSEAAALVGATRRTWQNWEAPVGTPNYRRMDPDTWERFSAMSRRAVEAFERCLTPKAILNEVPAEWQHTLRMD